MSDRYFQKEPASRLFLAYRSISSTIEPSSIKFHYSSYNQSRSGLLYHRRERLHQIRSRWITCRLHHHAKWGMNRAFEPAIRKLPCFYHVNELNKQRRWEVREHVSLRRAVSLEPRNSPCPIHVPRHFSKCRMCRQFPIIATIFLYQKTKSAICSRLHVYFLQRLYWTGSKCDDRCWPWWLSFHPGVFYRSCRPETARDQAKWRERRHYAILEITVDNDNGLDTSLGHQNNNVLSWALGRGGIRLDQVDQNDCRWVKPEIIMLWPVHVV